MEASAHGAWLGLLERHAREQAEKTAIAVHLGDGRFDETSYADLLQRVRAFAQLFDRRTQPGQVVPLCLARGADAAAAMLGALSVGRAFCCVNQKLRIPQIEHIVAATRSPCALIDEVGLNALRGELSDDSPLFGTRWLVLGEAELSRLSRKAYERLAAQQCTESWTPVATTHMPEGHETPQRAGACLFTSGSTGLPKGVLISCADLRARALAEVAWYGLSQQDVLLNVLPFSFDVGLNQLLSAITVGAELVVLDSWLPRDILRVSAARGVTGISGVPSIWADLMREGGAFDRADAHRKLRYITVSGGDMTRAQHERLPAVARGIQIFKTYGQTEAFRASSLRPDEYAGRPGSVGRPFLGVHLYIARDDGTLAEPGESGEVVHSGLGVMLGYLDGSDPQRKLRENPWHGPADPSPKVIFTGDIGYLDAEGYLYLSGRRDDMAKIQGNRVYPGEVRNQIAALPGVASVEVIVARTASRTELVAFVIPEPSAQVDARELRVRLQRQVPSYMVPELLCLRESLPRTASGKPDRVSLAAQAVQMLSDTQPAG
ncbi:MAG: class I adenylate-forming enzyme family protein [Myxococcales bacterium]